jgi:hypothetical protein
VSFFGWILLRIDDRYREKKERKGLLLWHGVEWVVEAEEDDGKSPRMAGNEHFGRHIHVLSI